MADIPPGRWVTLSEAAHYFEVSERTIRRRIERGQLRTEHTGGRVLILIYDTQADKGGQDDTAPATSAKVAELAAEVRRLSDLLSQVEGERDRLYNLLAANAQQKLIEAQAAADPEPARGESKTDSGKGEKSGRRWWWPWGKG